VTAPITPFIASDEQKLLVDSVRRFLADHYAFEARQRSVRSPAGYSEDHWRLFAELGWLALPIAERYGGLGGSPLDVALLMEQFGRSLVSTPFLASHVLAAGALAASGDEAKCVEMLPRLASGEMRLALAFAEPQARYDHFDVETTATRTSAGWRLDGRKSVVYFAAGANRIIVSARVTGARRDRSGIGLFLVDPASDGLQARHFVTHDGGRASDLTFRDVRIPEASVLADGETGLDVLEDALDCATSAVCAEAVGAMTAIHEQSLAYAKIREQFGAAIASFQALQHRMVDNFIRCELARSVAMEAAEASAGGSRAARMKAVSAAKVHIGRSAVILGREGIQIHGGVGMTDDLPVGHLFKRLVMINTSFGDVAWHLKRYQDAHDCR
jgi:alkylation response protein AidB-like acyl-CoA dehydrogenase